MTTIYALCDPASGEIRYVGKTTRAPAWRLRCHIVEAHGVKGRGPRRCYWIRSLEPSRPLMRPLVVVPDRYAAEMERRVIQQFRSKGYRLTNLTDGGEGTPGYVPPAEVNARRAASNRGKKRSAETCARIRASRAFLYTPEFRARISASLLGRKPSPEALEKIHAVADQRRGKQRSPEICAKVRAAKQHVSAETREKLRRINLGKKHTAESRAKISANNWCRQPENRQRVESLAARRRGRKHSDQHRAAIAAALVGRVVADATKEKIAAALRGRGDHRSPAGKERWRAAMAARQPTPEQIERHRAAMASPETRAKLSAARRRAPAVESGGQ